ncbi:glycosyltransferase family 2 protein [Nocardioides donggukensis]|uniref:Glycosyltransferase family 2 protein n=1 Tax=Nocardioides donggukensis TaxID=2774019 RepID=A0A927K589_9ACTN|nr:glycosyltransferase family 2 protein [Nocardioides donggukensis]MBD8870484.1 glycosyltransferase family 2 protein [Nocardioides donggukensis]
MSRTSTGSGAHRSVTDVAVVMVTWNSAEHLPVALASLEAGLRGLRWRLVVADNDSADDTVAVVRRLAPDAAIVHTGRNAGYAAGLNLAIDRAGEADAVLCLNPDVRLEPDCVRTMVEAAQHPGVGIVAPRLVDEQGRLHRSLRREPRVTRALGEALIGGSRAGRFGITGEVITRPEAYESGRDVDWATGAVLLVTSACQRATGPWDESFFLYSEETDYALRARDAGYTVRYCPEAVAMHVGGDSGVSSRLYALLTVNRIRLYGMRHGRLPTWLFRGAVVLGELVRSRRPVHRAALRAVVRA